MQKILPFLWFDSAAEEAARFYASSFPNSSLGAIRRYGEAGPGTAGSVMSANFELSGLEIMALNGGPIFTFTPAVSFFVACDGPAEVDAKWQRFSPGGSALMELGAYPFNERYGWVQDRFGLSWQFMVGSGPQPIKPCLLFSGPAFGQAEGAMERYVSLFPDSRILSVARYGPGLAQPEGAVGHAEFRLAGIDFCATESAFDHGYGFSQAQSFFVNCESQAEVDRLWEELSSGGERQQCGWLRDRYGVSWQIVPTILGELLSDPDPRRAARVMKAMLGMGKLDIAALMAAAT